MDSIEPDPSRRPDEGTGGVGELDGTVVLVTGLRGDISRVLVIALSTAGATVAVNGAAAMVGRTELEVQRKGVVEYVRSDGGRVTVTNADCRTFDGAEGLVRDVRNAFGQLDVLVNCFEPQRTTSVGELTETAFDEMFSDEVLALMGLTKAALSYFCARSYGKILNVVVDIAADQGSKNAVYAATRSAVFGLTHCAASEGRDFDVTANLVSLASGSQLGAGQSGASSAKLGRLAELVVHLATAGASVHTSRCMEVREESMLCDWAAEADPKIDLASWDPGSIGAAFTEQSG